MKGDGGSSTNVNTLAHLEAKNRLWRQLWLVALDEAYNAKDSRRRMDELSGLPNHEVVEVYFRYHPEMKQWADAHVAAGTCEEANRDLRATLSRTKKLRAQQRAAMARPIDRCDQVRDDAPEWMKPFMLGPAQFEPSVVIDDPSAVIGPQTRPTKQTVPEKKILDWMKARGSEAVARGELLERDPTINAACKPTGLNCRRKDARSAWDRVPSEMRRGRGKPANRPPKSAVDNRH